MKGLYIERHNEAVAAMGKAIMEGAKGGCLTVLVADAGWHGKVTGLCAKSRIPSQVLPGVPEDALCRMRPDLLLLERDSNDNVSLTLEDLQHPQHRRRCKVHVIEVGYCTELAYAEKFKEKYGQHSSLLEHLRNSGYADMELHLLIFGSTGGMFKLTALHLKQLGIPPSKVDTILQDMHWKALKRLEQITGTRRRLEHDDNSGKHGSSQAIKRTRET